MSEIKPSAKLWSDRIARKHETQWAEDPAARNEKIMQDLRAGNEWLSDVVSRIAERTVFDEQPAFLRSEETKWEPTRE